MVKCEKRPRAYIMGTRLICSGVDKKGANCDHGLVPHEVKRTVRCPNMHCNLFRQEFEAPNVLLKAVE